MEPDWPFAEPPETEVIALRRVVSGESPLRLVTHDAEDGAWQFLDGEHVFEDDAVVLSLLEMVQLDPSVRALADLPAGWYAIRQARDEAWRRQEGEPG